MGWQAGWKLNDRGREQVLLLAERLSAEPIHAVYSSPLERTMETAAVLASKLHLHVRTTEGLGESRLGEWEGMEIAELDQREDWRRYNTFRSGVRAPGGDLMLETQTRMIRESLRIEREHSGDCVALVSHADPIRAVLAYFLGIPLDLCLRLEISPASVSVVEMNEWSVRVLCVNQQAR